MKGINIIFIIALFIPELFKTWIPFIYWILEAIRLGGSLYYIVKYSAFYKKSTLFNSVCLFHFIILLASIVNDATFDTYKTIINVTLPNIAVICYLEIITKNDYLQGLKHFKRTLEILVLCNFIFMLFYPKGLHVVDVWSNETDSLRSLTSYLLSFKNRLILWFLPLMIVLTKTATKKESFIFNFIMLCQLVISESVTSIFVFFIFYLLYYLQRNNYIKKINLKIAFVIFIVIFFALVFFQVQNYFENFLVKILGKNIELQGRLFIWDAAVEMIQTKWILGYGNSGNGAIIDWNGYMWYAHNLILDILIQGGVCALFVMAFIFWKISIIPAIDNDHISWLNTVYAAIIALLVESTFESFLNYPQVFLIIGLTVCYNINNTRNYECLKKL